MSRPSIGSGAWVAPNATLTGSVALGDFASIWYGCVLRGDLEPIAIGDETNVQDLTVVHVDHRCPVTIGRRVTIGHRAVVHGCTIDDEAVVGMGAVLLSGSRIGAGALVAAGAVVREGFTVPPGAVAAGVPAVLRGKVDDALRARFREGVESYLRLAARAREGG
ncbi:MAG TPA: gamma carbonic anhydrase family protein [Candidatus Polarisedimenticolaceae bacterium]|nr:gamma carbonic anhydrase family protein [Candidatus Polarisedimenticolaceae bacterium]